MAEIVRYVNPASTAGGDGTTNATSGASRAYASLSECEANEQADFVTATNNLVIKCVAGTDTTFCLFDGSTTSATYDIRIEPDSGSDHAGVIGAGYEMVVDQATFGALYINDDNITIYGIQITNTNGTAGAYGILCGGANMTLERCYVKGGSEGTTSAVLLANTGAVCRSCVFDNSGAYGAGAADWVDAVFEWCGAYGNAVGFNRDGTNGTNATATCCVAYNGSFADWFGTKWSGSYNASSDSSEIGTNPITTDIVSGDFVNAAGGDYNLASGSTLIDAGISSGRPALDFAGNSWATNDVGPFAAISGKKPFGHQCLDNQQSPIAASRINGVLQ